jgi:nitrogen fixation protein FixH
LKSARQLSLVCILIAIAFLSPSCGRKADGAAGPLHLQLAVSPDHPSMTKPIMFRVHVTGANGEPVTNADVSGALTMKIMDMGTTQLKFTPKGGGEYETSSKSLDMSGPWGLVITAKEGVATAKQSFDVNVSD